MIKFEWWKFNQKWTFLKNLQNIKFINQNIILKLKSIKIKFNVSNPNFYYKILKIR